MERFMESQESYSAFFEDQSKIHCCHERTCGCYIPRDVPDNESVIVGTVSRSLTESMVA